MDNQEKGEKPVQVASELNDRLGGCPFCGSEWVKLHQFGHCFVMCHGCLTYGSTAKTGTEAIAKWNAKEVNAAIHGPQGWKPMPGVVDA